MKTFLLIFLVGFSALVSNAQVTKVSLQASGLTCSMCSKAVLNALQKVGSVDKVEVNIKNQQYNISFKNASDIDFGALVKAVEDAGFSVANFTVTADINNMKLEKDQHIQIGKLNFHFLNAADQQLNGATIFTIVDKSFTSAKNHKKYSDMSKMECVQTGHMAKCCSKDDIVNGTRIYHAII
jgi:copper chaperone CopZ